MNGDMMLKILSILGNIVISFQDKLMKVAGRKKRVVQAIALSKDGKIFVVHHRYRKGWHLPGGNLGFGEHPRRAIIRELSEEIGIFKYRSCHFVARFNEVWSRVEMDVWLFFISEAEINWTPTLEIDEVKLVNPGEIPLDYQVVRERYLMLCGSKFTDRFLRKY